MEKPMQILLNFKMPEKVFHTPDLKLKHEVPRRKNSKRRKFRDKAGLIMEVNFDRKR